MNATNTHRQLANEIRAYLQGGGHNMMTKLRNFFHITPAERFVGFGDWCRANADMLENEGVTFRATTWGRFADEKVRYGCVL